MLFDSYILAFSLSNLGPKSFQKIMSSFESPEKAWKGTMGEFENVGIKDKTFQKFDFFRKNFDIRQYVGRLEREKVIFIPFTDKRYPKELQRLENPPIGLFAKGNVDLLNESLCIAVVGTRKITTYGKSVTESLVGDLVTNDVCIVSGLALGVDGVAHRTAVANNGKTVAVLACGVDCCNPSENFSLYSEILKNNGIIISEYPLSCPPNKGAFLARNRIIAAISDGILITEAAEDSGSLVTAEWGLSLSKKVFAVPGPITSRMSDGSLKLLKKGAKLVSKAEDILIEFETPRKVENKKNREIYKNLNTHEKKIISLLENEEMTIDEIARKTKLPVSKLFVALSGLELKRIVKNEKGKLELFT